MKELFWKIFTNVRAIVLAVIVHVIVLGVLVVNMNWINIKPATTSEPTPVKARVVEKDRIEEELDRMAEDKKIQEEEKKRQQQAQRKMEEEKRRKRQQEEKVAAEKKRQQEESRKRRLAEEVEKKRKQEEARKRRLAEEAEKKRKQKLAEEAEKKRLVEERKRLALLEERRRQKAMEEELRQAMHDEENESKARELIALIKADVQNNWKIPPTFRKGMECLLLVRLLPSGEVQNVRITRSSGDAVFDRSVEDAIYKASPLPVSLSSAGGRLFRTTFREFNFLFKPG